MLVGAKVVFKADPWFYGVGKVDRFLGHGWRLVLFDYGDTRRTEIFHVSELERYELFVEKQPAVS